MFKDTPKRQDRLKIMCFVQGVNNKASGIKKYLYNIHFLGNPCSKKKYVDRKRNKET